MNNKKTLKQLLESKTFAKENKHTLDTISYINSFLYALGEVYTISFINMHSLFINTSGQQKNNNLILVPKGFGKTTFLKAVAENNKKKVTVLPEKMYESLLSKRGKTYFNNKLLVHYDLIQALSGVDKKQREQLVGFWTSLLSDGRYHRQNQEPVENIKCSVAFGMAKESFVTNRRMLYDSTMLDRMTLLHKTISMEDKSKIYDYRVNADSSKMKLKFVTGKRAVIFDSQKFSPLIKQFVMELDKFKIMTSTRAQDYVCNFLLCNAFFNSRNEVTDNDYLMYRFFHEYHIDTQDLSKYERLLHLLNKNPKLTIQELQSITKWPKRTVYRYYKMVKDTE